MLNKKVIWSEGMYLQPQHLQQQDRYIEHVIQHYSQVSPPYIWGVSAIELDSQLIGQGKIGLIKCTGIFPDGTVFNIPYGDIAPVPLLLPSGTNDLIIYLVLPLKREGIPETKIVGVEEDKPYRHLGSFYEVIDNTTHEINVAQLQLSHLNLTLKTELDDLSGYTILGIARIKEAVKNGNLIIDENYIPACTNIVCLPKGRKLLEEVYGLLSQRAERLAKYIGQEGQKGIAEIQDFLLLQLINRYEPVFKYLSSASFISPESLYLLLLQLVSELSTFTHDNRRIDKIPGYHHENLSLTFIPLIKLLRNCLSRVAEPRAFSLPLEKQEHGIWVSTIDNPVLFKESNFILVVKAAIPNEQIISLFPSQVKIAPIENIQNLIKHALPGVPLKLLSTTPREIPFHSGCTYFIFDNQSPLWDNFEKSSALALHVAGHFPELELELWSVKI